MQRGFSLVELSIVLVILGLLTGGILAGQSLIRAAELRSVSTEYQRYQAAVHSFRDKYFQLPGDMTNATSFWGAAHATPATCLTTVGTGTQSCNGNGDGDLDVNAASQYGELFTFWQHLANAGLIEGNYTGRAGSTGAYDSLADTNVAKSKLSNGGWYAASGFNHAGDGVRYTMNYANLLGIGSKPGAASPYEGAVLRPEEAWNIDTKLDDGKPAYGKVIALYWNNGCAVADDGGSAMNDYAASYKLADTSIVCALYFRQAF